MATHPRHFISSPQRSWRLGLLPSIPVGVLAGAVAASLAHDWRWTTNHFPLDPGPATDLLIAVAFSGVAMLAGLGLLVGRNAAIGAWLFVLGVAVICGVAIGFFA